MPKKVLMICSGCGREELEEDAKNWFSVDLKAGTNQHIEHADVCSFACLGRYAHRRESELNPDYSRDRS